MRQVLTFILVVTYYVSFCQGTIEGYVIDSTTKKPLSGTKLTLLTIKSVKLDSTYELNAFLQNDKSKLVYYYDTSWNREKVVYSDSKGYYYIDSVKPNNYRVHSFFKIKEERGRIVGESQSSNLFHFAGNQKQRVDIQLGVFCSYDSTKDLVECPKCHKSDGIRTQVYGLPGDMEKALQDDGKHHYNGYCVITRCQPTKICLRCRTEF